MNAMTARAGLLEGIRVLDLSRVMSGPFCTSMLADLGAEVIKVEMPGSGDEGRSFGPFVEGESSYFMLLNRNKKSVTVDMKSEDGHAVIRALIPKCDILVENFRPGVMARLGLDEPTVRQINPGIIYTSISGFGQDSPLKAWPAFDLVIQAMSGLMSLTGPRGGPATAVGESVADVCTGMFAAFGTLAALFDRERSGKGRHVDVAMLDSMMAMQLTGLARRLYMNDTPKPAGNRHPVTYPVDSFATTTGDVVMVCFSDKAFSALAELMGEPELAGDPRFSTNSARNDHEDLLRCRIAAWTGGLTQDAVIKSLLDAGIPAAPVWDMNQLVGSDHVAQRGLVETGHHRTLGDVPLVPQPVRFSGDDPQDAPTTPELGEHTEAVLRDVAGADDTMINRLRDNGTI
ncbi:CaiB/BaiF CoA transferase family protein [Hoeflea sp.]|uniref:CaiB/BaiF CoA transferase family protein n=1 Tax=Hoeflea sp. TaxID=1940281 RepID=UPI003B01A9CC